MQLLMYYAMLCNQLPVKMSYLLKLCHCTCSTYLCKLGLNRKYVSCAKSWLKSKKIYDGKKEKNV